MKGGGLAPHYTWALNAFPPHAQPLSSHLSLVLAIALSPKPSFFPPSDVPCVPLRDAQWMWGRNREGGVGGGGQIKPQGWGEEAGEKGSSHGGSRSGSQEGKSPATFSAVGGMQEAPRWGLGEGRLGLVEEEVSLKARLCLASSCQDARFTSNPPSMVAAAAVASAIQGVLHRHEVEDEAAAAAPISLASHGNHTSASAQQYMQDLYLRLHDITQIDTDCLKECHRQIEIWTQSSGDSPAHSAESTTPTDMQDVMF
ncbi:G1/S-specific cyclin-D1 [Chionoecetes opilio]|uniref:G1/S-specific cyclin-D1 n=1 Tax=Chionoecetes opilio TaxID=41210 RepID=A0A8J5D341_CHIOP|nr:G1/S-specific cyclin-D1 [Chionoecetes opilio]